MALFCQNICKFNRCGLQYATVYDLIQHIEETHMNYEPEFLVKQEQQQPNCVALSYVYKVFREPPEKKAKPINPDPIPTPSTHQLQQLQQQQQKRKASSSFIPMQGRFSQEAPANRVVPNLNTPNTNTTHNDIDDDSNTYPDDTSSTGDVNSAVVEEILNPGGLLNSEERKYKCPVTGCNKTYKNLNGMRYHTKMAHSNSAESPGRSSFRCQCGKEYKKQQGLQTHMLSHKTASSSSVPPSPNSQQTGGRKFLTQSSSASVSPAHSPAPATSAAALAGGHQYHQPISPAPYSQGRNISYPQQIHRSSSMSFTVPVNSNVPSKRPPLNGGRQFGRGQLLLNPVNTNTSSSDSLTTERN